MIRIIIYDDNQQRRDSLTALLSLTEGMECVASFPDCSHVKDDMIEFKPDVVLMDIDMPGESGIGGVRLVKEARPQTSVIMYTVFEDDEKLFQCLCAGANGYLLKQTPPQKLFDGIQEVIAGGAPMSPVIARKVVESFQIKPTSSANELSNRENEVLDLISNGYRVKEISDKLCISINTVRTHIRHIYEKLQVQSRVEALNKRGKKRF